MGRISVVEKVRRAVDGATAVELGEAARMLREMATRSARFQFRPGMRVRCPEGVGRRLTPGAVGVVERVNTKTISVDFKETVGEAGPHRRWRMAPMHLEAVA